MTVLIFLIGTLGALILVQNAALLVLGQPPQLAIDPGLGTTKPVRLAMKLALQGTLVAALLLYPAIAGSSVADYYGPMLRATDWSLCWKGWLFSGGIMAAVFLVEARAGAFEFGLSCPTARLPRRLALRVLSCVTVVAVEEPLFRGVLLKGLTGWMPAMPAILISAAVFSGAHFLRRHKETWAALGLFLLGVQLGVAYVLTGSLWLPMGLHSGGVLVIQIHRVFVAGYRGPAWLTGTRDFPIAGAACITLMVLITGGLWLLFR
jgi:membrane protease YdiL (CAAX protease family)